MLPRINKGDSVIIRVGRGPEERRTVTHVESHVILLTEPENVSGAESRYSSSLARGVNPDVKIQQQAIPSLTVRQWNAVVDVLGAEELSATPNADALEARNRIRQNLREDGYRRTDLA